MTVRTPTPTTLRIRKMARIERLKDKVTEAEHNESVRADRATARIEGFRNELENLLNDAAGAQTGT